MSVLKTVKDGKAVAYRLEGGALIIGRGPTCQIVVDEEGVLPRQCQVVILKEGCLLKDLSGKGVLVNGKRVRERVLCEGDVVVIGTRTFTFSGNLGRNTARLVAESAPKRESSAGAGTSRMATATRATKAAPPPPEKPSSSTTRSTKRATGRVTGRVQTQSGVAGLRSTRKGKLIAAGIVAGIVGVSALLMLLRAGQVRPEDVKARLQTDITALNKMPMEDNVARLAAAERLLSDPQYEKYGGDLYRKLVKEVPKLREAVNLQRAADKDVRPFLSKYEAAKADKAAIDAKAQDLYDEAKSLFDRFSLSHHAARLTEIVSDLKSRLENRTKDTWERSWVKFTADVQREKDKGDCARALQLAEELGEKYKEKEDAQLAKRLAEQREAIKRHSDVVVERLRKEVLKLAVDGSKDAARKQVEAARPGLDGFPAAAKLAALLKDIDQAKP